MMGSLLHISPTYYSERSVVGGGEKYILYMSRAIRAGALACGYDIRDSMLAFGSDVGEAEAADGFKCDVIAGQPWDPLSITVAELKARIRTADVILVHQCLSAFGLFVASHARLENKVVIGLDEGGGDHALVYRTPEIGGIFDLFLAYSQFCAASFKDLEGRVEIILGPVDTDYYRPNSAIEEDHHLVLAVGRLLPHKGFDRIIRALPGDMHLVIAGNRYDQEYYEYLHAYAGQCRFDVREHLKDDEILSLMRRARVFVHASTHSDYRGRYYAKPELLGLAPLEALSTGTPTLVSSAGALPELAKLKGCRQFDNDRHLSELLSEYASSSAVTPSREEVHRDVDKHYGLKTFGGAFLTALATVAGRHETIVR